MTFSLKSEILHIFKIMYCNNRRDRNFPFQLRFHICHLLIISICLPSSIALILSFFPCLFYQKLSDCTTILHKRSTQQHPYEI